MRPSSLLVAALGASTQRRASFLILRDPDPNKNYKKGFNCYLLTDFSPNVTLVVTHQQAELIQGHVRRRCRSGVKMVTVGGWEIHSEVTFRGRL